MVGRGGRKVPANTGRLRRRDGPLRQLIGRSSQFLYEQPHLIGLSHFGRCQAADPLAQVALPELAGLRRSLLAWLATADTAGLDEDGIVALFTSALRDFHERRSGSRTDGGAASGEAEAVA